MEKKKTIREFRKEISISLPKGFSEANYDYESYQGKIIERLELKKKEKVNYVYSDGMEYVSNELLTLLLVNLDKLADECIKFSECLLNDGDKPNAHFQEGQGKGIKLAIEKIGGLL